MDNFTILQYFEDTCITQIYMQVSDKVWIRVLTLKFPYLLLINKKYVKSQGVGVHMSVSNTNRVDIQHMSVLKVSNMQ